jgi:Hydrolytic ATP binding site of dynein motor region
LKLSGAVQSGCWVCLDDLHKVHHSIISVAAQMMASAFAAKRENKQIILFASLDSVDVSLEFGIFITQVSR